MVKGKNLFGKKAVAAPSASTEPDVSGCEQMEGPILRKNTHGQWKPRYGRLINNYFMTYKPKSNKPKPTNEVKEAMDLREVVQCLVRPGSSLLELTLSDGAMHVFKGDDNEKYSSSEREQEARDWAQRIEARIAWCGRSSNAASLAAAAAASDAEAASAATATASAAVAATAAVAAAAAAAEETATDAANRVHIAGYLMKKSHNKYQGLQERYVKLQGSKLTYHKRKKDEAVLGFASMETAEFVRPFDEGADCVVFEVQDQDRVFLFQCRDHDDMMRWVDVVDGLRKTLQERMKLVSLGKKVSEKPIRLRWFDEQGEDFFIRNIQDDIRELYPVATATAVVAGEEEGEEGATADAAAAAAPSDMGGHLACLRELVLYLQEFLPECERTEESPARYDVLAVMLSLLNAAFTRRIASFVLPGCGDDALVKHILREYFDNSNSNSGRSSSGGDIRDSSDCAGESNNNSNSYSNNSGGFARYALPQEQQQSQQLRADGDRHPMLERANLGDLHNLIDWIAKYQIILRGIKCPVAKSTSTAVAAAAAANDGSNNSSCLSATHRNPKVCGVFDLMPTICSLYVHGGSTGAKGGAASHLKEHCSRVWENLLQRPGEMLHRRKDGAFFTHTPVDMWEAINQHIALATSTASPVLHVMIAEKVVPPLMEIFEGIIEYVRTFEVGQHPQLQEMELEYVAALANDTALHIENVIELIETFTLERTKEKIDEIFDPLTNSLVNCGEACLKRLAALVMSDVQQVLQQVFTQQWLQQEDGGEQVQVVTATISDYLSDFDEYLRDFWSEKFVYIILQEALLCYIRCVLQLPLNSNNNSNSSNNNSSSGDSKRCAVDAESLGRLAQDGNAWNSFFGRKAGQEVATEFLEIVNEVSLLLFLPPDAFTAHVATRIAEFPSAALAIRAVAAAIMKMRPGDFPVRRGTVDEFFRSVQPAIAAAPAAAARNEAAGVAEGRLSCLLIDLVPPQVLRKTAQLAAAATGISSNSSSSGGDGSPLSLSLSASNSSSSAAAAAAAALGSPMSGLMKSSQNFLAQKRNLFSHIPLFGSSKSKAAAADAAAAAAASAAAEDEDDEEEEEEQEEAEEEEGEDDDDDDDDEANGSSSSGALRASSSSAADARDSRFSSSSGGFKMSTVSISGSGLVDNVLEQLQEQQQKLEEQQLREEQQRQQLEAIRNAVGVLTYDGYLEKKSPATNLWQRRFFKLQTRETFNPEDPFRYSLLWFKKAGGTVLKSLELEKIKQLAVVKSPRALAYLPLQQSLVLQSEAANQPFAVMVKTLKLLKLEAATADASTAATAGAAPIEQLYAFRIVQSDGKDHVLRGAKVDRFIKWMNLIAKAAKLGYDQHECVWNRAALQAHKQLSEEQAAQPSFMNTPAAATTAAAANAKAVAAAVESNRHSGGGSNASAADVFDPAQAAALIRAAKKEAEEKQRLQQQQVETQERETEQQRLQQEAALDAERATLRAELNNSSNNNSSSSRGSSGSSDERRSSVNPILAQSGKARETENPLLKARSKQQQQQLEDAAAATAVDELNADGGTEVFFYRSDSLHSEAAALATHTATAAADGVDDMLSAAAAAAGETNRSSSASSNSSSKKRSTASGRVSFAHDVKGGAGSPLELAADDDKQRLLQKNKPSKCCCIVS